MRTISIIVAGLALVASGLYVGYKCYSPKVGETVVQQEWLDSLYRVAQSLPDTITITDTIWAPPEVVTVTKEVPLPVDTGSTWAYYEDSLKNEWIHMTVKDTVRDNRLAWREWEYELYVPLHIIHRERIIDKVPFPYPVEEDGYDWYAGGAFGTDGWRVRGGTYLGRWQAGAYVGRSHQVNSVGIEFSINF